MTGYYAAPKQAKKVLSFDSDDSDNDEKHGAMDRDDGEQDQASGDDEDQLTLDDHIERILRKTRTLALLRIANNTAELLSDEDEYFDEDQDFDEEEDDAYDYHDDDDAETHDSFVDDNAKATQLVVPMDKQKSFRREQSMRRENSMRQFRSGDGNEVAVAALRLARKLSSFLSLPRMISYKDLEMVRLRLRKIEVVV